MPKPEFRPPICDYEGSNYRTEFWEGKGRNYEDRVERIALRRLLPDKGQRLLEIGAGFGRLTSELHGYQQVVLLDYSLSQLRYAQEQLGTSGRYIYVAADAYALPFRPGSFDAQPSSAYCITCPMYPPSFSRCAVRWSLGGVFILEYANKRNMKAIYRYATGKQDWNPNDLKPVEFVELNFDFHPGLHQVGTCRRRIFDETQHSGILFPRRHLKNALPTEVLAGLDGLLQLTGLHYTPSIFTRNIAMGDSPDNLNTDSLFVCPDCGGELTQAGDVLTCQCCHKSWAIREGIYDFKAPLED